MRTLDSSIRVNNFEEVNLGYNRDEAVAEASRCLNCANPRCVLGCPVNIQIPKFIQAIKENKMESAASIIEESNSFPGICGRVCPQEKQCEAMCIKGFRGDAISIGSLERYVADWALENKLNDTTHAISNGKRVAIIGSGPSGLACASVLAFHGCEVTIYEALHKAGGVLAYGIPEFRLPKRILQEEIDKLKKMGVNFVFNTLIGATISFSELKKTNDAIYVATGAGLPKFMGIKNEMAKGVFSANEILTRINLMKSFEHDAKTPIYAYKKCLVVGGGNVAMDAARSIKRMGGEVSIVYRRSLDELPARREEVLHAYEEGIEFNYLVNPLEVDVDGEGHVLGLRVAKMELIDEGGKRKSVREIPDSSYVIPGDMVIMAIGTNANPLIRKNIDLECDDKGLIIVDGTKTSDVAVFAGGDAVTGAATVILAMEAGKKAGLEIGKYLGIMD